jgi:hypothetical protein
MREPIDRDQVLVDARRIEELSKAVILAASPNDDNAAQLGCAGLALILDGYSAVMALLGTTGEYHAPTVVRTMLEAFADLNALANDKAYAERMRLHAACERKKVIKGYVAAYGENRAFEATAQRARSDLYGLEPEITRLRDQGIEDYKVWERFQLAGLGGDRVYVYGELSSFAHADYIAIMLRHIGREKLILGHPLPDEWFAKVVFLSSTILLDGLLTLSSFAAYDASHVGALRDEAIKHYERLPLVHKLAPKGKQ